jgi:MFS family permease
MFIFSVVSSTVPSYGWLTLVRFFVGVAFGLGQPSANALVAEITPTFWRSVTNATAQSLFAVGEVFSFLIGWCDNPSMTNLNWRLLTQEAAFPSFCFFMLALVWLLESPSFSVASGKTDEAHETLRIMACDNCKPELSVDFLVEESEFVSNQGQSYSAELRVIFSGDWLITTIILMYTCFVMNFVYYGALYAFPQILATIGGHGGLSPALTLLIGACWEFPGYAVAGVVALMYPRQPITKAYLVLVALCLILFAGGVTLHQESIGGLMWHVGFFGTKICMAIGYVVVYTYLAEVYPTDLRVSGVAVSMACGRIGAMFASVSYELLTSWTQSFQAFFVLCAILCISNVCLVDFLPFETFHTSLLQYYRTKLGKPLPGKESSSYGTLEPDAASESCFSEA